MTDEFNTHPEEFLRAGEEFHSEPAKPVLYDYAGAKEKKKKRRRSMVLQTLALTMATAGVATASIGAASKDTPKEDTAIVYEVNNDISEEIESPDVSGNQNNTDK